MTEKVFVYGTLKDKFANHQVIKKAGGLLYDPHAKIHGFKMYNVYNSFPAITPSADDSDIVHGELYLVNTLDPLDHLEGYPGHYTRTKVETSHGLAWVYFYPEIQDLEPVVSGFWSK